MRNLNAVRRSAGLSAVLLGASALVLAGCGAPPAENEPAGTAPAGASDYLGCIVSDAGGFDDRSFNQSSYEGLMKAKEDLGIQTREAESKAETDFVPNLDSMMQAGCDLTLTVGFLLGDATKETAAANPDRHFAIVDYTDPEFTDNVKPIVYDTAQAAFLAGYLAAGTSGTGKVATYGGVQIPTVTIFMDGFADGVKYYNEQNNANVELLGWNKEAQNGTFVGNFDDQGKGKINTRNFINEGADVVMPVAGPVGLGTLDAVIEANNAGKDVKVVWVDADGYETAGKGEEFILTSVMKLMGQAVEDVIRTDLEGKFDNTPYVGTLENGGVALAPFHDQEKNVPDELKSGLETIKADIISGKIKVESEASPK
ncbi:BMP family ABC transporter substrate-binding protein [Arthrobacter sp. E918]|uniref:BMP family ABC transporter substrate-binding protein n=1 Tax=Arthrobacter mobilis TaxID=2724944 RepID=A0A7X6HCN6_9MICC|nr:BMP family ABC transporter substrate-binding protein [Arthrobacter mobilis]NKX53222.1 BMP family ABC transporter substrate-binding protein [Arthrobacter mobilis]